MKLLRPLLSIVFVLVSVNVQLVSSRSITVKPQNSDISSQPGDKVSKADAEKKIGELRGLKKLSMSTRIS